MKRLLPKSEFSRNVLTLMTGTTIAQTIPIAISPILTRIYTPEDFGAFALYMSITNILSVIATGRYELAIMLPKKDAEAVNIVALSITIAFCVSLISTFALFIFNTQITDLLNNQKIADWLYFAPISVFLLSNYQIFSNWFNRKQKYMHLSTNMILQNITLSFFQITLGLMNSLKNTGLITGQLLSQFFSALILIFYFIKHDFKRNVVCKQTLVTTLKHYKEYPTKNILGSFINTLASQMPIILIGIYYGSSFAGVYMMSMKILSIPMVFMGRAFSQVFYQKAIEKKEQNTLHDFVIKNTKVLTLIIIPPMLILGIFSQSIFSVIFGEKWIEAGEFARYLIPMTLLGFIYSAQSSLIMILGKLEFQTYFSSALLILQSAGFLFGYYVLDSKLFSILLLSIAGTLVYSYNIYWLLKASK